MSILFYLKYALQLIIEYLLHEQLQIGVLAHDCNIIKYHKYVTFEGNDYKHMVKHVENGVTKHV